LPRIIRSGGGFDAASLYTVKNTSQPLLEGSASVNTPSRASYITDRILVAFLDFTDIHRTFTYANRRAPVAQ